jgi:AcrR family transcriptional regulator
MCGIDEVITTASQHGRAPDRTDRRVSRTRRALKEALTDLILETGYEAVTVQEIIDRADVGRSTFYAHFSDKEELLMAILSDLQVPGPDVSHRNADDPAFGWTLELFLHFGSARRLFKALASSQSGPPGQREMTGWLEDLAQAELRRLRAPRKLDPVQRDTVVRFLVGTFMGFMVWWMREENEDLPAEAVDHAFRSLVMPGVANVLGLDIDIPNSL